METIRKNKTPKKIIQKNFLNFLEVTGNISMSCKKAKLPRRTLYEWIERDAEFKKLYDVSLQIAIELLEDEAQRRAFHGTSKPVYQGGKKVGVIQEYSDTLLMFLLKGKKPEVYKDRHELTGKDGKDLNLVTIFELPDNGRDTNK